MKLTILETGYVPEAIRSSFDDYPTMFEQLMAPLDSLMQFEAVSVISGAVLPDPGDLDAVLITGSPASVYHADPWIGALRDYIREVVASKIPMIGICYGHQAIADALGARVEKSDKGWGIGRHVYDVKTRSASWMDDEWAPEIATYVSHQDQVLSVPDGAEVLAGSDFTPNAALLYHDGPALSFQCHPEFSADYAGALYEARKGRPLTPEAVADAMASLNGGNNHTLIARWMVRFLQTHAVS